MKGGQRRGPWREDSLRLLPTSQGAGPPPAPPSSGPRPPPTRRLQYLPGPAGGWGCGRRERAVSREEPWPGT